MALIDLNAGAHITDAKAKENLKGSGLGKPGVDLNILTAGGGME